MMHVNIDTDGLATLAQNLHELLPGSAAYTNIMRAAAANALAKVKQRIHQQGQASDGGPIGAYSVKPIYISTVTGAGKGLNTHVGKTGKSVFSTGSKKGQPHTNQYFAGGYGQFKSALGLSDGNKVNLYLTGELCNQLQLLGEPGSTGYGLGWTDEQLTERAQALELKYGKKIWALTEEEKAEMMEEVSTEVGKTMK
jgi:hypothetical protein